MVQVLDWRAAEDPTQLLAVVVDAVAQGQLVGMPTETVYGIAASASVPRAVERLQVGKGRAQEKPLTLAIHSAQEALRWVPAMGLLGRRLARRSWPGPVTLAFRGGFTGGLLECLTESVRRRVCPADTLGLRIPDHPAAQAILAAVDAPLVLTSANRTGEPPARTADEVIEAIGAELTLIVDDGPSPLGRASTVVLVEEDSWRILREGEIGRAHV